jgi:hypothetical protein
MKQRKSDIPPNVTEVVIREYREEDSFIYPRLTQCILDDQVVGQRAYDRDGNLTIETPMKNGKKHGREFIWSDDGTLESVEPYVEGKLHGLVQQYSRNGKVIGTYRFIQGSGFDIWRHELEDGTIGISEIHGLHDGLPHDYEWWLRVDQHSISHERYWHKGMVHGIERMWNDKGRLKRGYPKFWIQGQTVNKRVYLKATKQDQTLPPFQEKDNEPERQFPTEIEKLLLK